MKRVSSRLVLFGLLFATLVAAFFAPPMSGGVAQASRRTSPGSGGSGAAPRIIQLPSLAGDGPEVMVLQRRDGEGIDRDPTDVFATPPLPAVARTPASMAEPEAAASGPASPPPVPFRLLGQFEDDGKAGAFLELGDQNLVVQVGDTIGTQYKVEAIDGGRITVTYLPLGRQQVVELGAVQPK